MKKSKILLIMALIVATLTSVFSGCVKKPVSPYLDIICKFTIVYSENENEKYEVLIRPDRTDYFSVKGKPIGHFDVFMEVYYRSTGVVKKSTKWYKEIPANEFKTSGVAEETVVENEICFFTLKLTVEDYRVTPTLVIDPAGAIEYTENERYVYKYDGNNHMPKALYCEYNGERIEFSRYSVYALPLLKPVPTSKGFLDVGVYEVRYEVESEDLIVSDTTMYKVVWVKVIIEIVE